MASLFPYNVNTGTPVTVSMLGSPTFIASTAPKIPCSGLKMTESFTPGTAFKTSIVRLPCESMPGQYANSVKNFYDYVRDWINKRF